MKPYELSGKRILVTGASSGIGRACAVAAASIGASVIMTGRREDELAATRDCCVGIGHEIIAGDIVSSAFVQKLIQQSGRVDGLVHAAGIGPMCPISMMDRYYLYQFHHILYYKQHL